MDAEKARKFEENRIKLEKMKQEKELENALKTDILDENTQKSENEREKIENVNFARTGNVEIDNIVHAQLLNVRSEMEKMLKENEKIFESKQKTLSGNAKNENVREKGSSSTSNSRKR